MKRRGAVFFIGMLLVAFALFANVVVEEVGALQDSFSKAGAAFDSYKFPLAIQRVDPVLKTLGQWEKAGRLQPQDEALLEKALELRGVCEFNLGRLEAAKKDFMRLIQLRPDYPFARSRAQKVHNFFEAIRNELTGTLLLSITPPDSQVFLDGRSLGTAVPATVPVLGGLHLVRVVHQGYDSREKEVNVALGVGLPVTIALTPNARTIYFFLRPKGVSVYLDGKPAGKAVTRASSNKNWARFAKNNGVDPKKTYVLTLPYVPPGKHRLRISKTCYEERKFVLPVTLDVVDNLPGYIEPISLVERKVGLVVVSHPSGAVVSFDGLRYGVTPLKQPGFCIGEHEVVVKKTGVGEYRSHVTVSSEDPFRLDVTLRPSLLWVGSTREGAVTAPEVKRANESLARAFGRLTLFNSTLSREKNPLLADTFFASGVDPALLASTVKSLSSKYGCEGLVAGLLRKNDKGGFSVVLRLYVPGLHGYDEYEKDVKTPEQAALALSGLSTPLFAVSPGKDVELVDVKGGRGPVFLSGPLRKGGPVAGDVLLAVDGAAPADAASALAELKSESEPVLRFLHNGEQKSWTYAPKKLVKVLPYSGPNGEYRRQWLLARQASLGAENPFSAFAARMNLAFADLNLGRPAEALKDLENLKPPEAGPLDRASVYYVRAVALVRMGFPEKAGPLLLSAAGDKNATLDGLGNILVEPLALDLLRQLSLPPAHEAGAASSKK